MGHIQAIIYHGTGCYGSSLTNTSFLQEYYGISSKKASSTEEALEALQNGCCVLGSEEGHFLAIIPVPDEFKLESNNYKFYILDSYRGHNGPFVSVEAAVRYLKDGGRRPNNYLMLSYIIY